MLMKPSSWQFYVRLFGPMKMPNGIRLSFSGDSFGMPHPNG
ncbi:hypothetical protein [Ferroacidibacillus organovorans]|nr:hypothetical protein [Ferroacidibacillus organovorans]